ncbi:hypothetical protein MS7884_pB0025 (plasmid) [Enterobacter hormaechei]|nr:hypothetical protein MS7884_pB0025 [Enterobacter hormaechei]
MGVSYFFVITQPFLNCHSFCEVITMRTLTAYNEDNFRQIEQYKGHCCKVSDEAAFCLIQRPYISKTLLTRRISPRGSP